MCAKKHKKKLISALAIFVFLLVAKSSCTPINRMLGLEDNHPLEEAFEDLIEVKTGMKVNLSETPEE